MASNNERILQLFTEREVLGEVTEMVEYIFDSGTDANCPPFTPDDVVMEADIFCPECGAEAENLHPYLVVAEEVEPVFNPDGDIDEKYLCPVCSAGYPTMEEAKQCCAGLEAYKCDECGKIISYDEYEEMSEVDTGHIFHWHLVTPWLLEKLKTLGEPTIANPPLWGRRTISQEAWIDDVIGTICDELEIMEGQKHDWSKHFKSAS